jgi:putative mRNA 3-end processing factor
MAAAPLIELRPEGLYCAAGDFHIDPWRPVPRAVLTHGHADHARSGSAHYLAAAPGLGLLHSRLGGTAPIQPLEYGERLALGEATISLHPAGHILGSSQVRVEHAGETWVITGDYKRDPDPTCAPFELVPCDVLITEATFALPVYQWDPTPVVARAILDWWDACARKRVPAVLFCYALGKAQRLLAELALITDRTACLHGAMVPLVQVYRDAGIAMLPTLAVSELPKGHSFAGELVLAPPSAEGSPWMRRFRDASTAFASGWMRVRGNRRRRGHDRGFVLSDHADWPALVATARECGARRVLATHGSTDAFVAYLRETGIDAAPLRTEFSGEEGAHG